MERSRRIRELFRIDDRVRLREKEVGKDDFQGDGGVLVFIVTYYLS